MLWNNIGILLALGVAVAKNHGSQRWICTTLQACSTGVQIQYDYLFTACWNCWNNSSCLCLCGPANIIGSDDHLGCTTRKQPENFPLQQPIPLTVLQIVTNKILSMWGEYEQEGSIKKHLHVNNFKKHLLWIAYYSSSEVCTFSTTEFFQCCNSMWIKLSYPQTSSRQPTELPSCWLLPLDPRLLRPWADGHCGIRWLSYIGDL